MPDTGEKLVAEFTTEELEILKAVQLKKFGAAIAKVKGDRATDVRRMRKAQLIEYILENKDYISDELAREIRRAIEERKKTARRGRAA